MAEMVHDLAIIGAGCTGLSLAAALAQSAPHLKIILIDPRTTFEDDRTWCFWTSGNTSVEALIATRWPRWRFSAADGAAFVHGAESQQYACVRAGDFYASRLALIRKAGFELRLGDHVDSIAPESHALRIFSAKKQTLARLAVDTRPTQQLNAKLFQVFAGVEIESANACFDAAQAGLMEDMASDADGFRFVYILPFSPTRALIELTRFAPRFMNAQTLHHDLETILARRGLRDARILRREQGVLPMGQVPEALPVDPRILRAGAAAGALRAGTGYAFLRIQHWARSCAASLAQGGPLLPHAPEPRFVAWLDSVFLTALRTNPERGADYFLRIANALKPDAFARFMSDAAQPQDIIRLMGALPPLPFVQAAVREALHA